MKKIPEKNKINFIRDSFLSFSCLFLIIIYLILQSKETVNFLGKTIIVGVFILSVLLFHNNIVLYFSTIKEKKEGKDEKNCSS